MQIRTFSFLSMLCSTVAFLAHTSNVFAADAAEAPAPANTVAAPAISLAVPAPVAEWSSKIDWSGDIRYRATQGKESEDDARPYQQLRARLGLKGFVTDGVQGVVRLATATSAISTNQTLGDQKDPGMARRPFGIDLAYIDAKILDSGSLWIGRVANPFWAPAKTQIVYDADLAFEGVALKWEPRWSTSSAFFNVGAFIISENYTAPSDLVDTGLIAAQIGYSIQKFGTWTAHLSTHQFLNIQSMPVTAVDKDAKTDAYSYPYDRYCGNTVFPNDPLLPPDSRKYYFQNGYTLYEIGLEWKYRFDPVETAVFADHVKNDLTSDGSEANEVGLLVKWKSLQAGYAWSMKQSDSVVAAFTDSDMSGGGTDNKGWRATFAYSISKNAQINLTRFEAKRGVDSVTRNFTSTQMDLLASF